MAAERVERPTLPEGVRAARDLRDGEPRAFGLELEGYAHLPRMLDKARGTLAGTAGSYQFGCPVDHTCMARLNVTPELVLDLVSRYADDRCVLQALRDTGSRLRRRRGSTRSSSRSNSRRKASISGCAAVSSFPIRATAGCSR